MGDRYRRSHINKISIGLSTWNMVHRYGIRYTDMVIYHIDMVILDIDMGCGLMIWEMTVWIWSSSISIRNILSLCQTLPEILDGEIVLGHNVLLSCRGLYHHLHRQGQATE